MIMKRWLAGVSAVALAASISLVAGGAASSSPPTPQPDGLGTDFWVTFPRNFDGGNITASVIITGPRSTTGTVTYPGGSSDFTVTAGLSTTVTLPATVQLGAATSTNPQNKGVHVTALDEISVVAMDYISSSADDYLAIPTDAMGTDHMVLGWGVGTTGMVSQFAVVATADNTEVTYTPQAATSSGIAAGTLTTAILNSGDVLPVSSSAGDLTGTPVTASKPVGVVGGHSCANIPTLATAFCDIVMDQLPPTSTWGTSFYTVPLKTRDNGDTFRILASEDNTTVRLNGGVIATLQSGQSHQRIIEPASQIVADKPVLVAQFSNGRDYDAVANSDPFMTLVPPVDQYLSEYTFATYSAPDTYYANLVVPTSAVGQVSLDGTAIAASAFGQIMTSAYSSAQVTLQPGAYRLESPEPVGITVYGYGATRGYGTVGGAGFAPFNAVDTLELGPASQRVQVGTQVCLEGKALDGADGLAGIPVELGIRGTESITDRVFSEMSGDFTYCYTRTQVGTDTVSALFRSVQSSEVTIEWFAPEPSVTPTPTPSASPAKLPITVTKVAPKRVALKANGSRVLVKRTTTNASGALTYKTRCKHTKRQPGAKHMCKVTVSSKGRVRVVSAGYGKLTVRVTATATPKPGQEQTWLPSTWRKTWKVKG